MNSEELKKRTKEFAHRCVKLVMALPNTQLGNHLRGQLVRCSTSVASNYRAACIAQSKASFISKLSIVIEEVDESYFWLEFIKYSIDNRRWSIKKGEKIEWNYF